MEEKEEFEICSNTSETSSDNPTSENEQLTAETSETESYLLIPYGFQSKAFYKPKSKSKEITGGKEAFTVSTRRLKSERNLILYT